MPLMITVEPHGGIGTSSIGSVPHDHYCDGAQIFCVHPTVLVGAMTPSVTRNT